MKIATATTDDIITTKLVAAACNLKPREVEVEVNG